MLKLLLRKVGDLRLKYKLYLSHFFVIIIPILVLGIFSFTQSKQLLQVQTKQSLQWSAEKVSNSLRYKINQYNDIMNFIVLNKRVQQIMNNKASDIITLSIEFPKEYEPFIQNIMTSNKDIRRITFYYKTDLLPFGNYVLPYAQMKEEPWFDRMAKGREFMTKWFFGDGKIWAVRNMTDLYSDKELGIVCMELDYPSFFDYSKIDGEEFGIAIRDERNSVIYSNEVTASPKDNFDSRLVKILNLFNDHPAQWITTSSQVPEAGLSVSYFTSAYSIAIKNSAILSAMLLIIGICLLVLMVMIFIFSASFVKRIDFLHRNMLTVQKGNLDVSVRSESRDELGQVTNQFGIMVRRLNDLVTDMSEQKNAQREAELRALQSQIKPHFLYNSLSVMNWKAIQIDATEISQLSSKLSKFYRTILNEGKNTITVMEELENVRTYTDIQRIIHDYCFEVEYDIDEHIEPYIMLNFLLQPIVENAIEHGIGMNKGKRGKVVIRGTEHPNHIEFTVQDNGPGIGKDKVQQLLMHDSVGYGLKNVNERIRLFFGLTYGISIESEAGVGTTVHLNMAKIEHENELMAGGQVITKPAHLITTR